MGQISDSTITTCEQLKAKVIEGVCTTEGAEGEPVYGVKITLKDNVVYECCDISAEKSVAERFADMINTNDVQSCHIDDLVIDFVEAQS